MAFARRTLGLTGITLPPFGVSASRPFNVIGKEAQAARSHLLRSALDREIDFFTTSPAFGDAQRILAAGLIGQRHRATVLETIRTPEVAQAYREVDVALHLLDGRIDILLADWQAASDDLLTSLARMRSMGDTVAMGVSCQSLDDLQAASRRVIIEGFDVIAFPATLLFSHAVDTLLAQINTDHCGLVAFVPDGLDATREEALGAIKVSLSGHGLASLQDVLAKLALSDARLASVAVPARRPVDLDRLEHIAAAAPFSVSEMNALRTG